MEKNILKISKKIKKEFGEESIRVFEDSEMKDMPHISTGFFGLDLAIGIGGYPIGRIIEVSGPEGSGKTTLIYHAIKKVQRAGGVAVFLDVENSMDPKYAEAIGVDVGNLLISQPDSLEETLNIAEMTVDENDGDDLLLVCLDSIAALAPQEELDKGMDKNTIGLQARKMGQFMRKIKGKLNKKNAILLCTNQIREKVGVMFGNPEVTPGGRALKFYASVRIDIRRTKAIKKASGEVGFEGRVRIIKNKVAVPFKISDFVMTFGNGIDIKRSIVVEGVKRGVVDKSGAQYTFKDISYKGVEKFTSKLPTKYLKIIRKRVLKEEGYIK